MKKIMLIALLIFSTNALAKRPVILSPFDALIAEQKSVVLKVKVEQDKIFPFRPDIENAQIKFSLDGVTLGVALSDDDGFARLKISTHPFDFGVHQIQIELLPSREFQTANGNLQLTIWPADQKIIVSDIDQTISHVDNFNVVLLPVSLQEPFVDAEDVLTKIKELDFKIVYLTAREDALFQTTKEWLHFHQFPTGHLIMWDVDLLRRRTPWNHGDFKAAALKSLREKFPNVLAGFGDKPHDIEAYKQNNIPAYLVRSRFNSEVIFPDGTIEFSNWADVWDLVSL